MTIYLYIKIHTKTGIKYFGKTSKKNPYTYHGSGKYWKRHIKFHGKEHVKTIKIWEFNDQNSCSEFALKFSYDNNIVNSPHWANLMLETGRDGNPPLVNHRNGYRHSDDTKQKMSITRTGVKPTDQARLAYSIAAKRRPSNLVKMKWWNDGFKNKRSIDCPGSEFKAGQLRKKILNHN